MNAGARRLEAKSTPTNGRQTARKRNGQYTPHLEKCNGRYTCSIRKRNARYTPAMSAFLVC